MAVDPITPTADPPPQPSADLAPDPAPQPAAQAEPGREESPAPAEGGEPTGGDGDGTPTPAAQLTALAEHVKEREKAATEKGRSETHSRMQPFLQQQTGHLRRIDESTATIAEELVTLKERAEDPEDTSVSMKDYNALLTKHKEMFPALSEQKYTAGWWGGLSNMVGAIGKHLGDDKIVEQFTPRFQAVANNDSDPTIVEDFVDAITAAAVKAALETDRPKTAKQARDNQAAEIRQMARNGTPPPAASAGNAGGAKRTVKDIEKMTAEQIAEIPKDELMAIMASG